MFGDMMKNEMQSIFSKTIQDDFVLRYTLFGMRAIMGEEKFLEFSIPFIKTWKQSMTKEFAKQITKIQNESVNKKLPPMAKLFGLDSFDGETHRIMVAKTMKEFSENVTEMVEMLSKQ